MRLPGYSELVFSMLLCGCSDVLSVFRMLIVSCQSHQSVFLVFRVFFRMWGTVFLVCCCAVTKVFWELLMLLCSYWGVLSVFRMLLWPFTCFFSVLLLRCSECSWCSLECGYVVKVFWVFISCYEVAKVFWVILVFWVFFSVLLTSWYKLLVSHLVRTQF